MLYAVRVLFLLQYHPLSELWEDWQIFVIDADHARTDDAKEMHVRVHSCIVPQ